jgi:hypothetical protein|tara:strand:- start:274 stop:450 length:177 start_codon:yes stop_codon:yes gene_type:complete
MESNNLRYDPYWKIIHNHWMTIPDIDALLDGVQEWVVDDRPDITLNEACLLGYYIAIA